MARRFLLLVCVLAPLLACNNLTEISAGSMTAGECVADEEVCDERDNDCDGSVDENVCDETCEQGAPCELCGSYICVDEEQVCDSPDRCDMAQRCDDEDQCDEGELCSNGSCAPEGFVFVPNGEFSMGSPPGESGRKDADEAQRTVEIVRPFFMGISEVTGQQYSDVLGVEDPSFRSPCEAPCPVEQVTWLDALMYANGLSDAQGLDRCYEIRPNEVTFVGIRCNGFRLPTEEEWEYAARAGATGSTSAGESREDPNAQLGCNIDLNGNLKEVGWYCENSPAQAGSSFAKHTVMTRAPNSWGLFDMLGNVAEMTWNEYRKKSTTQQMDFSLPTTTACAAQEDIACERAQRGGAFQGSANKCRLASRLSFLANDAKPTRGFRVVRTVPFPGE